MHIALFSPQFRVDECVAEIRECLENGWTGLGFKTVAIEEAWKDYTGLPHAHFINSNTAGLHLALECLKARFGWGADSEIITTPLTFVSTNHAILHAGMRPVFADVDDYLCLDPESVAARITPKTRAVIFVGMGGNVGQYDAVVALCERHGLKLILDAAHMSGTRVRGRHVGAEAEATVFSFQAVKNLPTADSGMICFRDAADDAKVRKLTWLGINKDTYTRTVSEGAYKWRYEVEDVGYKYHGNSIMAAIALVQLKYLDHDNAYRRRLAGWYRANLAGRNEIQLISVPEECESSSHLFQIRVRNRDLLMLALNETGVFPGVHYRDNTEYRVYAFAAGTCPKAAQASNELISLPLHLRLTRTDVDYVCQQVVRHAT